MWLTITNMTAKKNVFRIIFTLVFCFSVAVFLQGDGDFSGTTVVLRTEDKLVIKADIYLTGDNAEYWAALKMFLSGLGGKT